MKNAMKRIRSEQLQCIATQYLKRRRYSDSEIGQRKERRNQSVEEMVLTRSVLSEGSMSNGIAYSSTSASATLYDQQFSRMLSFVTDPANQHGQELEQILCPLYVNMYLQQIANGQITPGHKFLNRYAKMFGGHSDCQAILKALSQLNCKDDLHANCEISEFRLHKYRVNMSESAITFLQQFLRDEENLLILQILNCHIDITAVAQYTDVSSYEERTLEALEPVSQPCTPENKVIHSELLLSSLQQCIHRVRDGPASPTTTPSVCLYTFLNTYQGLCSAHISSNEKLLCGGFEDSSIHLWSLTPEQLQSAHSSHIDFCADVQQPQDTPSAVGQETTVLRGHSGAVYGAMCVNDSRYLISASEDTTVRLWDVETNINRVCYRGHAYPVWGIDTSEIGGYFASCSQDRTTKLWNTNSTYPLRTLVGHLSDVDVVKFHPNGNYIATGSSDKTVRLWSVADGRTVRLLQGHRASVMALAFSPDGKMLASAGEDRRIKVWDLTNGNLLKDLRGHMDTIYSLAFNRHNNLLASGGMDSTIRIWHLNRERPVSAPESPSSPELLTVLPTKATIVQYLRFASKNFLLAAGNLQS